MDSSVQAYVARLLRLLGDDDPLEALSRTPAALAALIAGIDPAAYGVKRLPESWSINQIVAHLADAELVAGYRVRMMLTNNGVAIQAYDQDRWAETFGYQAMDARVSAQVFGACRLGTLRVVAAVAPTLLEHHGIHEERGHETVRLLVKLLAGHDRNHLAQIERIAAEHGGQREMAPVPQKPEAPLDLLDRLDLRVGTIVDVTDVSGAARLMRLDVDFGAERRTVIAGIKEERSDPRVLIGRQALFVYNLPRRTIRGQESQAMLCDVGHADGLLPALLQPEWQMPNGSRAG